MALSYRAAPATSQSGSGVTSFSVTKQAGTAAGDWIFIYLFGTNASTAACTGFTVKNDPNNFGCLVYRRADGTEGAGFTITGLSGQKVSTVIVTVAGATATLDPSTVATPSSGGASTSIAIGSVTLTGSTDWVLWFGANQNGFSGAGFAITPPSGFTSEVTNGAQASNATIMMADNRTLGSGATGTQTGTCTSASFFSGVMTGLIPASGSTVSGAAALAGTGTLTAAGSVTSGSGTGAAIPAFGFLIDWNNDGDFSDTGDNVTSRASAAAGLSIAYGRDQARAFSPARPGQAAFTLVNTSRDYYPDNASSPLAGNLVPGRPVKITATQFSVTTIYRGFLDDYTCSPNKGDRTVTLSCLDLMARFQQANPLSTQLYASIRTGTAIGYILDQLGWPSGARDLDPGATFIRWWWEEGTDGLTALGKMLAAEGPPAICYVDVSNNFVFRDRHHRYLRPASATSQATFTNGTSAESASTVTFSQPMTYDTGWRDICNTVLLAVDERDQQALTQVWQQDAQITLGASASTTIIAQPPDPFTAAVTPVAGTDFTVVSGAVSVSLSRTSGQSATITLTDAGSGSIITGLSLRACPVTVARTIQVTETDSASVTAYGVRGLPDSVDPSFATTADADAVAGIFVARYAQRKPIVTIPVSSLNDKRLAQQLARDLSDRVRITDTETGLDADFFIEQISHETSGTGRVLTTTFGCEKADATSPSNLFVFDDATNGKFNTGTFGT